MDKKKIVNPKLQLSKEEMRSFGYKVVDLLVSHFENLPNEKPVTLASRAEMDALLQEPIPEYGTPVEDVLAHVIKNILPNTDLLTHTNFFSFCPSPNNFISTLADTLATGFNIFSGGWIASPAAAEIEIVTINWLLELFNFPQKQGGGLYTSGGSMANLIGVATARKIKLKDEQQNATLYLSQQTHSSNHRAAKILGFREDQIRTIPTDKQYKMLIPDLSEAIEFDRKAGKSPFCIIATAGTTNTGAVDPLQEIAGICQDGNLWMHVDAAYGGAAILTEHGQEKLKGIERADSITIDPHKWLFQPYEIGCILMRDHTWMMDTFRETPEYLRDFQGGAEEINFYDRGVQLTRRFRALKLYMSIKSFGLQSFRQAVQTGIDLAEEVQKYLEKRIHWEIISPATLAVINYRYKPEKQALTPKQLDELNQDISDQIIASREAMLATTVLDGKIVLRMCLINPRSSLSTVVKVIDLLETFAEIALAKFKKTSH